MAQHDYNIANQSGASFRQDLNNALSAVVTLNSGAASPSTTFAYQLWADTTAGVLKIRNAANNAWITLAELDGTLTMEGGSAGAPGLSFRGDTNTGFFSAAADELAIATGGIQRLIIDSSGRVLLGPGAAGRAVGGAVVAQLGIETLGQALSLVRNSADTSGAIIALGKSRATTAGGITAVQDLDILGELRFCGANGTDLTSIGAHIRAIVTGVVGSGGDTTDMPTSLTFSVTPDGDATAAEAMRIDPSKRVLVGTTTAQGTNAFQIEQSSGSFISLRRAEAATAITDGEDLGAIEFQDNAGGVYARVLGEADGTAGASDFPGRLVFSTTADGASTPSERMRIDNAGRVGISAINTSKTLNVGTSTTTDTAAFEHSSGTMTGATIVTATARAAGTACYFVYGVANAVATLAITNNGDVRNLNGVYASISDIKLKENIVDANSQWDDIKALRVRNYNLIEGQTHTQIGLIAQEVELVSPGLVGESPDRDAEGNDLGTVTKSVSYSVLYMKAVKALQEAMQRIEQLEIKVAALEGN